MKIRILALFVSLFLSSSLQAADLAKYKKTTGVSGNLNSIGSDTLNNLMTYWAEGFRKQYPNVRIQVEGKGSSTAPPALIEGVAQLGPMSRAMKNKEVDKFKKKYGFKPTAIPVAIDSLAVYVHKDNPIKGLNLKQVDAIFSKNLKGGSKEHIKTWGQLGLAGAWATRPISLYGRNSASGTYGYFKKKALFKGDYKDEVKEQPGSASVVSGIAGDRGAIGYSGIGYKTSGVRAIALSSKNSKTFEPTFANALNGNYPLGRSLYIYIIKKPNAPLPILTQEFLKFVLSDEGQAIVEKDGYGKLPPEVAQAQLRVINNQTQKTD